MVVRDLDVPLKLNMVAISCRYWLYHLETSARCQSGVEVEMHLPTPVRSAKRGRHERSVPAASDSSLHLVGEWVRRL
jgi:hypothetical protein